MITAKLDTTRYTPEEMFKTEYLNLAKMIEVSGAKGQLHFLDECRMDEMLTIV